jgi:hypothetical protein
LICATGLPLTHLTSSSTISAFHDMEAHGINQQALRLLLACSHLEES